jgi:two-component system, chemotaxis family, sensor kinase CheA
MDDLLRDFVVETSESIEVVDNELVRFEQDPNNRAIIAQIFRLVHTIKGTCGFLGLPRLEALTHAAESAIDRFREGAPVTRDAVTLILATIDRVKLIMAELDRSSTEPAGEDHDLIGALETLTVGLSGAAAPSTDFTTGSLIYQVLERPLRPGEVSLDELERAFRDTAAMEAELSDELLERAGLSERREVAIDVDHEPARQETSKADGARPDGPESAAEGGARRSTIRVQVDTLEHLMTMVSELVLTRNQLLEISRRGGSDAYKVPLQRLSQVTAELQESVMKTRMQPIGTAWTKLPRLMRDLCSELGKDIDIETHGAETEIDRQLLELIRDPMLHMIRNAADHGIEAPAERLKVGKPVRGQVRVSAAQEGGFIVLSISDDGRGLDLPRIRHKIAALGLASEQEVQRLNDQQVARYIFHPGFSTAQQVTNISGRGVGMDVVRTNIEQIGGSVDVRTTAGQGATIAIKIPLTLAIAAALIVECHGHRFALPQAAVVELVRATGSGDARIEHLSSAPVLRLRERLLPLVQLGDMLKLNGAVGIEDWSKAFIVVCEVGKIRFGIVVDNVLQTEEIVVKPVSTRIRHLSCYSGATILGDGTVIMILDPNGLTQSIATFSEAHNDNLQTEDMSAINQADKTALLVFRAGSGAPMAVPLATVTRLEEIDVTKVEHANGQPLVQYRGALMKLVTCSDETRLRTQGTQPVLVFARRSKPVGIVVDEIIDIIEEELHIKLDSPNPGFLGSAVLRGKATDIIDIAHFIPELGGGEAPRLRGSRRMLLCETSDFIRAMLAPVLQSSGFEVHIAQSADEAERKLAWGGYQIVVANIEGAEMLRLPDLAGPTTRFIGVANRASRDILGAAERAGFDDVVGIFDRQGLLASVHAADLKLGEAA